MSDFVKVATVHEVKEGAMKQVRANGKVICLARMDGEFFAIGDTCSHQNCSLSTGFLDSGVVVCSCHGGTFDVTTGQNLSLPAPAPVPSYKVKVEGEDILIEV